MVYIIKRLETLDKEKVFIEDIDLENSSVEKKTIEYIGSEETFEYQIIRFREFNGRDNKVLRKTDSFNFDRSNPPFPTFKEEGYKRKTDITEIVHHLYQIYGEGYYMYQWLGGNPPLETFLSKTYIMKK